MFRYVAAAAALLAAQPGLAAERTEYAASRLLEMGFADLMNVRVVSVSKAPERRMDAAAAVHVITGEDIRRAGVTTIPDALRLVPGIAVGQITSNQWAVGVRGLGTTLLGRYSLVLIDGRSLYTPISAGTNWDTTDVMLEDVDRIEVILGPGGALWGSNAVNGVINIITKSANDTPGTLITAGGGTEERAFGAVRHGFSTENAATRVYAKYFDRAPGHPTSGDHFDDWQQGQAGFRSDIRVGERDTLTVQGDAYRGNAGHRRLVHLDEAPFSELIEKDAFLSGGNVLARWSRRADDGSGFLARMYYDRMYRRDPHFTSSVDTGDVELQHALRLGGRHLFTYGLGYRASADHIRGSTTVRFDPSRRTTGLWNVFLQDQFALVPDRVQLTGGAKFEHNDFTGLEIQPNGRVAWTPTTSQTLWAAVSRSVRIPARIDGDPQVTALSIPPPPVLTVARLVPNDDLKAEELIAYELGYRLKPARTLLAELSGFYNAYEDFQSATFGAAFVETDPLPVKAVLPIFNENEMRARIYGGETALAWTPRPWWRLEGSYSLARVFLSRTPGSSDLGTETRFEGSYPQHTAALRSFMDLPGGIEVDPTVRYVAGLPFERIPAYWTADLHLGWRATERLELSVVGRNLFQERHAESNEERPTEVERGVYDKVAWRL